ncbi:hypothetical protein FJTKL_11243 [Diaporthe vaccinii]|uniref:Myb-like domain-containing protein n=1 Tax=Diaporthe vaccinii TaxID=105482 RepID=A0ABR4EHV4_9PEZI
MVRPQFRQMDVQSIRTWCQKKEEKKTKLAQLKRQREREEQQQQLQLPETIPEPDVGITEAQTMGNTIGDYSDFFGCNFGFNAVENLGMHSIAYTSEPSVPPFGIGCITTVNSSAEDLPLTSGLVLHSTVPNTSIIKDGKRNDSGDTYEAYDEGSDGDGTNYSQDLALASPKFTSRDSSGMTASQILSEDNSSTPDSIGDCAGTFGEMESARTDAFTLPTPRAYHTTMSRRDDATTSRRKRGHKATEEYSDGRHLRERKKSRHTESIPSPALPAGTYKRSISTQHDRSLVWDNDPPHSDSLAAMDVDNSIIGHTAGARGQRPPVTTGFTLPLFDRFQKHPGSQTSNQPCFPSTAIATDKSPCHHCGCCAEALIRMSDEVQALAVIVRDFAMNKPSRMATIKRQSGSAGITDQNHTAAASVGPLNAEQAENDKGSGEVSGHDDDRQNENFISSNGADDPKDKRWEPLEERRLRAWVKEKMTLECIARKLGRSELAIKQKWGTMTNNEIIDSRCLPSSQKESNILSPLLSEDGQTEYGVEKILEFRKIGRGGRVCVRRVGSKKPTWEPLRGFLGTEALLAYEREHGPISGR